MLLARGKSTDSLDFVDGRTRDVIARQSGVGGRGMGEGSEGGESEGQKGVGISGPLSGRSSGSACVHKSRRQIHTRPDMTGLQSDVAVGLWTGFLARRLF